MEGDAANGEPHGRSDADAVLKVYASELRLQRQTIHAKEESDEEGLNEASQGITLFVLGIGKGYAV